VRILLDTNVLLRLADAGRETHTDAIDAVDWLAANGYEPVLVPQNLYEYWVVATRPVANNGLGMAPQQVDQAISYWLAVFRLLLDERGVFKLWRELVTVFDVKGKMAHDARLVAAMQRHDVTHLLTFNQQDFRGSPESLLSRRTTFSPEAFLLRLEPGRTQIP
jgi:predicted nucleic acid-binding protein